MQMRSQDPAAALKHQLDEISDDLVGRLKGGGVYSYSPAKTHGGFQLLKTLGLSDHKKTLVAYTSSLDEHLASKLKYTALQNELADSAQPFDDQIQWLQSLRTYCKSHNDLQLIVRVHPREGRNHRDSVRSDHLKKLQDAFEAVDGNCRFIWPEEPTSSYDLAEVADIALARRGEHHALAVGRPDGKAVVGRVEGQACEDVPSPFVHPDVELRPVVDLHRQAVAVGRKPGVVPDRRRGPQRRGRPVWTQPTDLGPGLTLPGDVDEGPRVRDGELCAGLGGVGPGVFDDGHG